MRPASLPLAYLAAAWLIGVAAAAFTGGDQAAALAAAGLLGAASVIVSPRLSTLVLVAGGIALIFGAAWRYQTAMPSSGSIARLNDGQSHQLRAVINDQPEERGTSRLYRLDVREARVGGNWQREAGGVIMRAPLLPEYKYGDLIEIRGELVTPPVLDRFDYREYLLRQGIVSQVGYPQIRLIGRGNGSPIRAVLIDLRKTLATSLGKVLPEPESALAGGILFGTRSDLPADLKADMNATGTSHLVAVSGQNVVLVAMLIMASLTCIIGRRPAACLALLAVVAYAILVGGQPSVVRAAVMGLIYTAATIIGRQNTAWIGLVLAGAGMTALDPEIVHNVSFQLSYETKELRHPLLVHAAQSSA